MVALPARLPVITPFASTVTYLVLDEEKVSVPTVSAGSSCVLSCSFSFRPMVVRSAVSVTALGAGDTLSAQSADTPL